MQEFWDQRYRAEEFAYGTEPNEFFRRYIDAQPPGRVLLPAEGEGRNAVYAARRGWQVDAYDFSGEARRKALALAERAGVTINYQLASLADPWPGGRRYALIALIFAHVPPALRRSLHRGLLDLLAPGGVLLMEAFSKEQLGRASGGPRDPDMLYSVDELAEDVEAADIRRLEQTEVELDEGSFHRGTASVIRLVCGPPTAAARPDRA